MCRSHIQCGCLYSTVLQWVFKGPRMEQSDQIRAHLTRNFIRFWYIMVFLSNFQKCHSECPKYWNVGFLKFEIFRIKNIKSKSKIGHFWMKLGLYVLYVFKLVIRLVCNICSDQMFIKFDHILPYLSIFTSEIWYF